MLTHKQWKLVYRHAKHTLTGITLTVDRSITTTSTASYPAPRITPTVDRNTTTTTSTDNYPAPRITPPPPSIHHDAQMSFAVDPAALEQLQNMGLSTEDATECLKVCRPSGSFQDTR